MSMLEVASELALNVAAPVRIAVPEERVPKSDSLALRDPASGSLAPAQKEGDGQLVALLGPFAAGERKRYELVAAPAGRPEVAVKPGGEGTLEIRLGDRLFTTYCFGSEVPRPFFYPVLGPGDRPVTRAYPMKQDAQGETRDHPHHRSLWSAYGEVNETDNWSEATGKHAWIRHLRFTRQASGPVYGGFVAESLWTAHDGAPVLREERAVRVYNAGADRRLLDYEIAMIASEGDVHFGDTKEGGIVAFRVATSMDGNKGGRIENSAGGVTEKECWGKPAAWCDYSGPTGGAVLGVAVMDHPGNFRHPTHWHVRDYGLFATNVFGTSSFEGTPGKRGEHTLKKGERLRFRYRILIHEGNARKGHVSDVFHGYVQPPVGKLAG